MIANFFGQCILLLAGDTNIDQIAFVLSSFVSILSLSPLHFYLARSEIAAANVNAGYIVFVDNRIRRLFEAFVCER